MAKNAPRKIPNSVLAKLVELKDAGAKRVELLAYVKSCGIDVHPEGLWAAMRNSKQRLATPDTNVVGSPTVAHLLDGGSAHVDDVPSPTSTLERSPSSDVDEDMTDAEWSVDVGRRLKLVASRVLGMIEIALDRGQDERVARLAPTIKPVMEQARTAMAQARMAAPQSTSGEVNTETPFAAGIRAALEREERAKEEEMAETSVKLEGP